MVIIYPLVQKTLKFHFLKDLLSFAIGEYSKRQADVRVDYNEWVKYEHQFLDEKIMFRIMTDNSGWQVKFCSKANTHEICFFRQLLNAISIQKQHENTIAHLKKSN